MTRLICSFAIILSLSGLSAVAQMAETPTAEPAAETVIEAKDIEKLRAAVGQTVTVVGTVERTGKDSTSGMNFLNFGSSRGGFTVVVFPSNVPSFPEPPEQLYRNKKVRITGKVEDHKGAPQIVLEKPEQVEIVEETTAPATQ